jgi:hypothetical protein
MCAIHCICTHTRQSSPIPLVSLLSLLSHAQSLSSLFSHLLRTDDIILLDGVLVDEMCLPLVGKTRCQHKWLTVDQKEDEEGVKCEERRGGEGEGRRGELASLSSRASLAFPTQTTSQALCG